MTRRRRLRKRGTGGYGGGGGGTNSKKNRRERRRERGLTHGGLLTLEEFPQQHRPHKTTVSLSEAINSGMFDLG